MDLKARVPGRGRDGGAKTAGVELVNDPAQIAVIFLKWPVCCEHRPGHQGDFRD